MVSRIINCKFVFYLGIFTCHLFAATKMPMPIITPSDTVFVGDLGASIAVPESAMVIYTQDGTDPSEKNGETYTPGWTISIDSTTTLKAIAISYYYDTSKAPSDIATVHYIRRLAKPYITGLNGTPLWSPFMDSIIIELHAVEPCQIFYTTDNTPPDSNSKLYIEPIVLYHTTTIKAICYKTGIITSIVTMLRINRINDSIINHKKTLTVDAIGKNSKRVFVTVSGRKVEFIKKKKTFLKLYQIIK